MPRFHRNPLASKWLAVCVLMLQGAVVVMFLHDPTDPPQRGTFWQGVWALFHRPAFVPFVVLLVIGPPCTWLSWSRRGAHRVWLVTGWTLFIAAAIAAFAMRMWVMLKVIWTYGT